MPHYKRERFLGRAKGGLHQGQIVPGALRDALHGAGFIDVDCYPVTMTVPGLHSPKVNMWASKLFDRWTLGIVGMFFAESYCVVFRKPL